MMMMECIRQNPRKRVMNPDKNNHKVRESPREDHERSRKIIESTSSSEMARSQYQSHEKQCPQANTVLTVLFFEKVLISTQ